MHDTDIKMCRSSKEEMVIEDGKREASQRRENLYYVEYRGI